MKHTLLKITALTILLLGLSFCSKNNETSTNNNTKKIIVAVFNGNGASPICVLETIEALKIDPQIKPRTISAAQIMNGALDSVDVLIFPGGSGSKELNNLGPLAAQKVKDFLINKGKGIVGICAGGYLLSTTPTYPSLRIIDAKNIDRKHYSRGRGLIQVKLTQNGLKIFPELKEHKFFVQYYDGPILAALDSNNITYTDIAHYITDIHAKPGIPSGVTPGKTFMLFQKVGKGKVFVSGGHPEATQGYRWMIPRMARYVSDGKIITYDKRWYRFNLYDSAYLFTPDKIKLEKQLFWQLFDSSATNRINAIKTLYYTMHSRPAVRWSIGLLRDSVPQVRLTAANILKHAEYSWALPDLKQALKNETKPQVRKALVQAINFLTY